MKPARSIQISPNTAGQTLTPDQKRFNTLIQQIQQARDTLAAWHANIPLYLQAHAKLVLPMIKTLAAAQREWTFALDRLIEQPSRTATERKTLQTLICDSAAHLLDEADEDDPPLKALFDKHAEISFDAEKLESRAELKQMMEAMTGLDLGDTDDIDSDDDLFTRLHERMAEHNDTQDAADAPGAGPDEHAHTHPHAQPHSHSRRQTAAQKRKAVDAELALQSVREIFRKLASVLHPDREPDPEQRAAKTALMQQANQAYAANDLLSLLELQLKIEQVDANHIANASAQRVKHYNKVLKEQLAELQAETERVSMGFAVDFGLDLPWNQNPAKLVTLIDRRVKDLRAGVLAFQRDAAIFADKMATKRWLKQARQHLREDEFDNPFF